ncbi:Putative thiamine pyrophosphate enzyme TPP-binding, thiamine pyrophosphate enzyme, central [Septoria linicola]|uniref:Pyruvate decarboxylase n=1 Tax=Septoria linicola TaxID=215465 RepID=A0A9Q9AP04_9PEZI|nr:putative thiamine pyrophosphate enzyme TPP-binding, thiamine pyrophosphate enzyme, central [Septoria linicola]USW53032.1 Putative thiamine pyrophosphate enzyme TPP-binding, thiamine pyrophosphate enzyme, central [Septoria linicola]
MHSLPWLPGDFSLRKLDFVECSGVKWVGNCNELNAGYAADAYARLNGLGALCTTFGVGELSAVNAVAGSYAERVPIVHIVGTPGRPSQQNGMLLHHTLGNGDFRVFARIYKEITISQTDLLDPATAPSEIDRVLATCYSDSQPVYIQLPTDMVDKPVDTSLLDVPIDTNPHPSNEGAEDIALQVVLDKIYAAERPVFLVDGAAQRRRILPAVHALIRRARLPVFVAPMGKGAVDEDLSNFVGVYAGAGCHPGVSHALDSSDLVITIGTIQSDSNTAGFTYRFSKLNTIDIEYGCVAVGYAKFEKVFFKSFIPRLEQTLDVSRLSYAAFQVAKVSPPTPVNSENDFITHAYLWPRLSTFLREGDILVTEAGTSFVGAWETRLPRNVVNQILWSSIGYGVGSFQLTCQELSTIIHHDLDITMFVIDNDGYEIERWVHGPEASYNDIPQWQYSKFAEVLTVPEAGHRVKSWKIRLKAELEALFTDGEFATGKGLQLVEMHMPRGDAPKTLREFAASAAKRDAKQ